MIGFVLQGHKWLREGETDIHLNFEWLRVYLCKIRQPEATVDKIHQADFSHTVVKINC